MSELEQQQINSDWTIEDETRWNEIADIAETGGEMD